MLGIHQWHGIRFKQRVLHRTDHTSDPRPPLDPAAEGPTSGEAGGLAVARFKRSAGTPSGVPDGNMQMQRESASPGNFEVHANTCDRRQECADKSVLPSEVGPPVSTNLDVGAGPMENARQMATRASEEDALARLVEQLANRDALRAEANIQADVRQLLLTAPLHLDDDDIVVLEAPVGEGRRIDVEVGATVIEVKRDLRKGQVREKALLQLTGYVAAREAEAACRYVGVLTDGADWRCYQLVNGALVEVSYHAVHTTRSGVRDLVDWLEGVMATTRGARPTPGAIEAALGARSSGHALDRGTLAALWDAGRATPSVQMKRALWAKLLATALGTQFRDNDDLFIEHTLLVNSAEIIAHAVLGLPIGSLSPGSLLTGSKFDEAGIHGVVEADFFDWVLEVPGGDTFVRTLARRLGRFDWGSVEHDVLKVLYESIIGKEARKKLGEYYTPDWLAEKVVAEVVTAPLAQRVLDPACGSGTFLFHALRRFADAAESAGWSQAQLIQGATRHVIGIDLHPVAVALARVTYLLGLGRARLTSPGRPVIRVPVYLGDSVQWRQKHGLYAHGHFSIETTDARESARPAAPGAATQLGLYASLLRFPEQLLSDDEVFDDLVQQLASKATSRKQRSPVPAIKSLLDRLGIAPTHHATIADTFSTMCHLHDDGRDHIWSYYVRNLARPLWLARKENRVDVIFGNPPWLAYRHMPSDMQETFRDMSTARGLWHGAKVATHQDLSGLFVARAVQLYLKDDGHLAFVMPNAVIDRKQFEGFRAGAYDERVESVHIAFSQPWDLRRLRPHFFPRGCAVVFGARAKRGVPMPDAPDVWEGRVESEHASWQQVEPSISRSTGHGVDTTSAQRVSPYATRFGQGATIVPRVLYMVERLPEGALGVAAGRARIRSTRSAAEKKPWRDLPDLEGVVETEFLRPVYVGESILPYRALDPPLAVIPWDSQGALSMEDERIELYPGLSEWVRRIEDLWREHRSSERLSLAMRLDYHRGLGNQFPTQARRVVYTKSGMHLAAARVAVGRAVIDHTLYWGTVSSDEEGWYLCAVLNSPRTTQAVRPLMSYGKDERHFDKYVWRLRIEPFDPDNDGHLRLAALGQRAEAEIASIQLRDIGFTAQRRQIRDYLESSETGRAIDTLVTQLLERG